MTTTTFMVNSDKREGYLAIPESGKGNGVLVLHAWWGLTDFFKSICDNLATQGYVAFAPDLHHGKIATTIDEAKHILETRDFPATQATAEAALHFLQNHPAQKDSELAAMGFSMGASFVLLLDSIYPEAFKKSVLFYGVSGADLSQSKSRFQCHYGENDDWEPLENVKQMKSSNAGIYTYPNASHWFFESDRPAHYKAEAATLAWKRTLEFLESHPK